MHTKYLFVFLTAICGLFGVPWPHLRGPIDPFICGDTFRAHCDFAFDEIAPPFNPQEVQPGNTIFINGDYIGEFFQKIHPQILSPYILIVHNTDYAIPGQYGRFLNDPKILAIFTQNQDETVHPKLHPLPIGVENRHWKPQNIEVLQELKAKNFEKEHLLYCNFNPATYPLDRNVAFALLAHAPFTYTAERKPYPEFYEDIAKSKFVLSPRGNGLDTHRFWETLYAGSFPVIKTSSLDALFEGLPVLIVQDWSEVTEEFLNRKYEEMSKGQFSYEKLYSDFWLEWINSYKPSHG